MYQHLRQQLRVQFIAFDERLDAWAARHWPALSALGYALSFVLLFGGVALNVHATDLSRAVAARCGAVCMTAPGFDVTVAVASGAASILFVALFAVLTGMVQRACIDPWRHVRPEPAPAQAARWAVVLHVLIGLILFLVIAYFAKEQPRGHAYMSIEGSPSSGWRVTLGGRAMLELLLGWWIGGRGVLQFFWPKPRIGGKLRRLPQQ